MCHMSGSSPEPWNSAGDSLIATASRVAQPEVMLRASFRLTRSKVIVFAVMVASYLFAEFSLPGGLIRRFIGDGSDDPGLKIMAEHRGTGFSLILTTANCLDLTVTVEVPTPNTKASRPTPFTAVIRGQQRMELATYEPLDPTKPWDFKYGGKWLYGCPGATPDGTVYLLPYEAATHCKLIQGAHGSYSHQGGSGHEYANDWLMPVGTIVLAARGGTVIGVRTDSTVHGVGERYKNSANYIIIRHSDGTYGEYLHFQPNAALVKLGDVVQTGQPIGRSGNSGYTSRPHLHFGVFRIRNDNTRESLPFKVRTDQGVKDTLEEGQVY